METTEDDAAPEPSIDEQDEAANEPLEKGLETNDDGTLPVGG
jgi:hypothetical protein